MPSQNQGQEVGILPTIPRNLHQINMTDSNL